MLNFFQKMCFCDGYYFLVTNKSNGEKHLIDGDETLYKFFEGRYSLPCLFHRLMKKEYVRHNDVLYCISYNPHPECQRVKMELVKLYGIEDPKLWKMCPEKHRYLLPTERR